MHGIVLMLLTMYHTSYVARHVTLSLQQKQNECEQNQQYRHFPIRVPEHSFRGM